MQVHARFFASYRDLIGSSSLDVEVPDGATVGELIRLLRSRGQPYEELPEEPAVALNLSYSRLDAALTDGDEVAFIPPVAGG